MYTNHTLTQSVPTPEDREFLEERLYEYNRDKTGHDDGELFAFFIRDDNQAIVAGLSGWTWARACEIEQLWVHASFRGQGYGRKLLQSAEELARTRGCEIIMIESFSLQAPGFYQKNGYELTCVLDGFPPGHQTCFLLKRFSTEARKKLAG